MDRKAEWKLTHEKILTVATDLFMKNGFKATSTREIAKQCGITQPNLYHHFKNKVTIYLAVIETLTSSVSQTLQEMAAETGTAQELLSRMIHFLLATHPANLTMMIHDINNELDEKAKMDMFTLFQQTYSRPFQLIFENESLRSGVTSAQAASFVLTNISYLLNMKELPQETVSKQVELTIDLLVHGIM